MIELAARREGLTFSQFVREAALMRAAWEIGLDQGADLSDVRTLIATVRDLRRALEIKNGTFPAGNDHDASSPP